MLAAARRVIVAAGDLAAANDEPATLQPKLWTDAEKSIPGVQSTVPVPVSRRRREVFERSQGRCHYCSAELQIDSVEVEHMQPRALDGDDHPLNLVAACRRCNREKSDRTALEFLAGAGTK